MQYLDRSESEKFSAKPMQADYSGFMTAGPSQVAVEEIGTTSMIAGRKLKQNEVTVVAVSLRPRAAGEQQLSAELAELQLPGNFTLLQAIQTQGGTVHTDTAHLHNRVGQ